ncbi:MAG: DUF4345 family protein [Pseudomonadota bacterium]
MIELLNPALALVSIGLGLIGWFAPRYTMDVLDLQRGQSTMGLSEMRAVSGCLFVGLGGGALLLGSAEAYLMVGCAWGGAAVGRATSLVADDAPTRGTRIFFAVEAAVAALLIANNL